MTNSVKSGLLLSVLAISVAGWNGCTVGPNYKRPPVNVPGTYRGPDEAQPATNASGTQGGTTQTTSLDNQKSLGDEKWWEVFQDRELQALIHTALEKNYDVRIAAARVLQAQAQLGITRADQFPSLSAVGGVTRERTPQLGSIPAAEINFGNAGASIAWTIDFWGRYRRATEAARANLLANEWAQRQVRATLVANVAASYFLLRQLDLQLEISRRTLSSRQESLRLTRELEQHGFNSLLDVRQSEQLVYTAATAIPDLERRVAQQENTIKILLGENPGAVSRGLQLTEQPHAPEVPAGLPSSLLERRADIREAEHNLIAANALIGVARAAYFPQITLTGETGFQSAALTTLFSGPAGAWNYGITLTQPIFQAGRLRSNVKLAEAQREQLLLAYQQSIQGAFRDVSDALIAYRKNREFRIQQEQLFRAAQDAARLSEVRFNAGTTDYLEVLTNETNSFTAELGLAQAEGNELLALVQFYQALGGGWQQ